MAKNVKNLWQKKIFCQLLRIRISSIRIFRNTDHSSDFCPKFRLLTKITTKKSRKSRGKLIFNSAQRFKTRGKKRRTFSPPASENFGRLSVGKIIAKT